MNVMAFSYTVHSTQYTVHSTQVFLLFGSLFLQFSVLVFLVLICAEKQLDHLLLSYSKDLHN